MPDVIADSADGRSAWLAAPEARGLIYWGQVPVRVTIGESEFTTALFPKDGSYLVPVKVAVQRAEAISEGAVVYVVVRSCPRKSFRVLHLPTSSTSAR